MPVQTSSGTFATGNPAKLFETASAASLTSPRNYDVAPDNQRFLMIKANTAADRNLTPAAMIVVQNWFTELNAKLPAPK